MWIYQQTTGELLHDGQYLTTGYSGHGEGLNSPAHETVPNVGPIPAGKWKIGREFRHPAKGPVCMRLTPVGHNAHGRSGFLIHGDNQAVNHTASEGCIILARVTRARIAGSGDDDLLVVV